MRREREREREREMDSQIETVILFPLAARAANALGLRLARDNANIGFTKTAVCFENIVIQYLAWRTLNFFSLEKSSKHFFLLFFVCSFSGL